MSIIATAEVPRHLSLRLADTHEYPAVPLHLRVRTLVDQGLTCVEIANMLHVTPYQAFEAGARLRSSADTTAVAAGWPPPTPKRLAELEAFGARLVAMPLHEHAARYGVSLDQAAQIRDLFAGSTR